MDTWDSGRTANETAAIPTTTFYSSDRRRAAGLVTLTPRTFALEMWSINIREFEDKGVTHLSRMTVRLRLLTLCAISAAKLLLCMRRMSTSRTLLTKNFLRPLGRRWRVFLLLP